MTKPSGSSLYQMARISFSMMTETERQRIGSRAWSVELEDRLARLYMEEYYVEVRDLYEELRDQTPSTSTSKDIL